MWGRSSVTSAWVVPNGGPVSLALAAPAEPSAKRVRQARRTTSGRLGRPLVISVSVFNR